jgi:asparagine synthase (glutamine-hydrolysing)
MCGIAGIASVNGGTIDPLAIKRMCDVLAHRGPDDAGYAYFAAPGERKASVAHISGSLAESRNPASPNNGYAVASPSPETRGCWAFADSRFSHVNAGLPVFGEKVFQEMAGGGVSLALGHRRLSIIELSSLGHQPMASADQSTWVSYNGEIYNFVELRAGLAVRGRQFRTRSDTEVLLALWEQHGLDCLPMLDGMFAFAVYSARDKTITLARDRFGVKPLYYAYSRDQFIFASETKAILASGAVEPRLEGAALVEYMTFQNLLGAQTLFADVKILGAGEYLQFTVGAGQMPGPRKFHKAFPQADASLRGRGDVQEMVAGAFGAAVKRQLVSDVEVGSYLSGGMDSGSIVSVASGSIPRLLTFTGGFDLTNVNGIEQGFDERKMAEQLSYILQTEHYDVVLHAGDMPAAMERIAWHNDDPRVGMCHQNWYVAKLASKFVKVCLAGAGGDELFAGYPWRYRHVLGGADFGAMDDAYFAYWHRLLAPGRLAEIFRPQLRGHCGEARESFDSLMAGAPAYQDELSPRENMLQRALYFEFKTFMHGFLVVEDRISMAHGLETRVPFLDNGLADLAWRIPPAMKLRMDCGLGSAGDGHMASADGKTILRQAMKRYLSQEFTRQPKQGFSPPDENWFRGPSMEYIKSILLDKRTLERPWFDQAFVRNRLEEHFAGRENHRLLIWSLLSIEWLQRHFVDAGRSY